MKVIRIAYIEDEPNIAELLKSGLGLFGITVHPIYMDAESMLNNMQGVAWEQVDIIFFDIRLPGMTGIEMAGELRRRGEKRPFVCVSAWPRPEQSVLDAIQAEFLPKPFDFPDVIRTIQRLSGN